MIKFNEVTWYSRIFAFVVFFAVVPLVSFYIGTQYERVMSIEQSESRHDVRASDIEYLREVETESVSRTPVSIPVVEISAQDTKDTILEDLVVITILSGEIPVPVSLHTDTIKPLVQKINILGAPSGEREASFRDLLDKVSGQLICTSSACVPAQVNLGCGLKEISIESRYGAEEVHFYNDVHKAWLKEFHIMFEC